MSSTYNYTDNDQQRPAVLRPGSSSVSDVQWHPTDSNNAESYPSSSVDSYNNTNAGLPRAAGATTGLTGSPAGTPRSNVNRVYSPPDRNAWKSSRAPSNQGLGMNDSMQQDQQILQQQMYGSGNPSTTSSIPSTYGASTSPGQPMGSAQVTSHPGRLGTLGSGVAGAGAGALAEHELAKHRHATPTGSSAIPATAATGTGLHSTNPLTSSNSNYTRSAESGVGASAPAAALGGASAANNPTLASSSAVPATVGTNSNSPRHSSILPGALGAGALGAGGAALAEHEARKHHSAPYGANDKESDSYYGSHMGKDLHGKEVLPVGTAVVADHHHHHGVGRGLTASTGVGLNPDESLNNSLLSGSQRLAAVLSEILAIAAVALVLVWVLNYREGFNSWNIPVHAFLGVTAFAFFITQAILAYRVLPLPRFAVDSITTTNYLFAIACVVLAYVAVYVSATAEPHLHSMHSWLSLATTALFILQVIGAFFHFCMPLRRYQHHVALVPHMSFLVLATYTLGLMTLATGIQEWQSMLYTGVQNNIYPQQSGLPVLRDSVGMTSAESYIINALGICIWALLFTTLYALMPTQAGVGYYEPATHGLFHRHHARHAGALPAGAGAAAVSGVHHNNHRGSLTDGNYNNSHNLLNNRKSSISAQDPTRTGESALYADEHATVV